MTSASATLPVGVVDFCDRYIPLNEKGKLWTLSKYQRAVLPLMYARDYSTRLWSEPKKSGKTMTAGCIAIAEAVTNADAEVISCANDEEQARSRVFQTAVDLCNKNPEIATSVVKMTQNQIDFSNGSKIRAISSDYKGEAGGRQRLTIFDELWAFDSERATRLFEEMRPPPSEPGAYILIVSYAGFQNESTVLESLYKRAMAGKRLSVRYPVFADRGLFCFWSHVARQPWHTKAFLAEEERNLRPNQFRRLYRNEWVSAESQFISSEQWDSVVDPNLTPVLGRARLFVGIDLGVKSDSTGVVAVKMSDDGRRVEIAFHRLWKPSKSNPVDLTEVEEFISEISRRHSVQSIVADPSQAYLLIQRLKNRGVAVEEFIQSQSNGIRMAETLFSMVGDKTLKAYPSSELREHVLNATAVETAGGARMVKGKQSKKIDLAIALSMALVIAVERGNGASIDDIALGIDPRHREFHEFLNQMGRDY